MTTCKRCSADFEIGNDKTQGMCDACLDALLDRLPAAARLAAGKQKGQHVYVAECTACLEQVRVTGLAEATGVVVCDKCKESIARSVASLEPADHYLGGNLDALASTCLVRVFRSVVMHTGSLEDVGGPEGMQDAILGRWTETMRDLVQTRQRERDLRAGHSAREIEAAAVNQQRTRYESEIESLRAALVAARAGAPAATGPRDRVVTVARDLYEMRNAGNYGAIMAKFGELRRALDAAGIEVRGE